MVSTMLSRMSLHSELICYPIGKMRSSSASGMRIRKTPPWKRSRPVSKRRTPNNPYLGDNK